MLASICLAIYPSFSLSLVFFFFSRVRVFSPVSKKGVKILLFSRLSLPYTLNNYFLGVTSVAFWYVKKKQRRKRRALCLLIVVLSFNQLLFICFRVNNKKVRCFFSTNQGCSSACLSRKNRSSLSLLSPLDRWL